MTDGGARSFVGDIGRQPANLGRVAATFLPTLEATDLGPFMDGDLVLTGMGASFFAAMPSALALRAAGRRGRAISATELLDPGGPYLGAPVVGISQSGRSAETVEALRASPAPRLAVTTTGGGPLAEVAEVALPIGSEPDAGISVVTYTAALFAIAALASRLGSRHAGPMPDLLAEMTAEQVGRAGSLAGRWTERFGSVHAVDVVGRGFSAASAGYAALLVREAARLPAAWFDTRQYLHGPVEAAEPGIAAVVFGDEREIVLARDLAGYGATVLLVTAEDPPPVDGMEVFRIPDVAGPLRAILEAVPAQALAAAMAGARGLSPGQFRREQADAKLGSG